MSRGATNAEVEDAVVALERLNPTEAPARSALVGGRWKVAHTTAPPPSNGRLGPFQGTAYQNVDLDGGVYRNVLVLPAGSDAGDAPVRVTLTAGWEEVEDDREWLVQFEQIELELFGRRVLGKRFPEGTTRLWRTTYIDDDVRVVRAARTRKALDDAAARGRDAVAGDEDDTVFVMTRC